MTRIFDNFLAFNFLLLGLSLGVSVVGSIVGLFVAMVDYLNGTFDVVNKVGVCFALVHLASLYVCMMDNGKRIDGVVFGDNERK